MRRDFAADAVGVLAGVDDDHLRDLAGQTAIRLPLRLEEFAAVLALPLEQDFARRIGAVWAGDSDKPSPDKLDAALIFAPVGSLIIHALRNTVKGGVVVSGGIHMSDIPSFPYHLLWDERQVRSVANLTRQDGEEFLAIAPKVPVKTEVKEYPLGEVNQALQDLRSGNLQGSAVLVID